MLISARNLPANRESERRDAIALAEAGFDALASQPGITLGQLTCYQRQRDMMISAANERYRGALA